MIREHVGWKRWEPHFTWQESKLGSLGATSFACVIQVILIPCMTTNTYMTCLCIFNGIPTHILTFKEDGYTADICILYIGLGGVFFDFAHVSPHWTVCRRSDEARNAEPQAMGGLGLE